MGVIKKNKKIFAKLENKGQSCMFVGYNEHSSDTYRIYVFATKRIVKSRDVLWLNTQYDEYNNIEVKQDDPDIDIDRWIEDEAEFVAEKMVHFEGVNHFILAQLTFLKFASFKGIHLHSFSISAKMCLVLQS